MYPLEALYWNAFSVLYGVALMVGYRDDSDIGDMSWVFRPGVESIVNELEYTGDNKKKLEDKLKHTLQEVDTCLGAVRQLLLVLVAMAEIDGLDLKKTCWYEKMVVLGWY